MSVRVFYTHCHWSEIVVCEAPIGTVQFWPWSDDDPSPWSNRVRGHWRLCEPVKDKLHPRVRVTAITHEIQPERLGDLVRAAYKRLAIWRQHCGDLFVVLKRYGRERKSLFPLAEDDILTAGFFYAPLVNDPEWDGRLDSHFNMKPEGCPTLLESDHPSFECPCGQSPKA